MKALLKELKCLTAINSIKLPSCKTHLQESQDIPCILGTDLIQIQIHQNYQQYSNARSISTHLPDTPPLEVVVILVQLGTF